MLLVVCHTSPHEKRLGLDSTFDMLPGRLEESDQELASLVRLEHLSEVLVGSLE